ncbi:MAG: hypothetical protein E7416_03440 [Ruminococcaceae bacterium]|nr:hypothetical protein [Oscillospiraceae bacterium]
MNDNEIIEKIIEELKKIAFADYSEIVRSLGDERYTSLIEQLAEVEQYLPPISQIKSVKDGMEIKFYDKLKALELLGKYVREQNGGEYQGDFDNLLAVLQSNANRIWEAGDKD